MSTSSHRFRFSARILLLCAFLLSLSERVQGQRAIASLGKRLKKRLGGMPSSSTDGYIIEGETASDESSIFYARNPHFIVAAAATAILLLVGFSVLKQNRKGLEEDDEIVVKDGHVVAMPGMERVDLAFEDLKLVLQTKRKKNGNGERLLLDGSVRGRARPGRMLAIMGGSGAGKSTLLHALAGRIKDNPKMELYGHRYMNGEPVAGDSMIPSAFIEQQVNFFPHMTVKETLDFRIELKLGSKLSKKDRDQMAQDLMAQLGLTKTADTIVGDSKVRGISGGERKRLSIAVEMISSPSVIFLDEPTSGLDSTAATTLVQTLRKLANSGKTVVAVIHQPSQHVFDKFDDLLLLSEGKLMYYGERKDVRAFFESRRCKASQEMGTAEHVLDCISRNPLENETQEHADQRIERLAADARTHEVNLGQLDKAEDSKDREFAMVTHHGPRSSIITQFRLLLKRSFQEVTRGKTAIFVKTVQQVTLGIIYGGIYSLGTNQASIQDRFGLLSLIAIGSANMAVASTIRSFPREKAIVSNEIASRMYRTLPYFIGKALSDFPLVGFFNSLFGVIVYNLTGLSNTAGKFSRFLGLMSMHGLASESIGLVIGAISPNSDVALALFPAVLVLNIIFDGKNISEDSIPRLLRWIPKVGLIRWGFEGLCVNEFEGLEFDASGPRRGPVAKTGADALARFGLGDNGLQDIVKAQVTITAACWALSYLGLTLTRQKFLVMQSPESNSNGKER